MRRFRQVDLVDWTLGRRNAGDRSADRKSTAVEISHHSSDPGWRSEFVRVVALRRAAAWPPRSAETGPPPDLGHDRRLSAPRWPDVRVCCSRRPRLRADPAPKVSACGAHAYGSHRLGCDGGADRVLLAVRCSRHRASTDVAMDPTAATRHLAVQPGQLRRLHPDRSNNQRRYSAPVSGVAAVTGPSVGMKLKYAGARWPMSVISHIQPLSEAKVSETTPVLSHQPRRVKPR